MARFFETKRPLFAALALMGAVAFSGCSDDCDPCPPTPEPPIEVFSHADFFAANPYVGPNMNQACIGCHANEAQDLMETGHYNQSGLASNIVGVEDEEHGKVDILNNFCIAIPTNEGRCSQCHIGTGWVDKSFNFDDPSRVDCLICHDGTGTYSKVKAPGGIPASGLDWNAIGAGIAMPNRVNCGKCHYSAGGGNNVKHGDLAASLNDTTRVYDVHMGTDGGNMVCTDCHAADEVHGIGGMPYHSVDEGNMRDCADCHIGEGTTISDLHADTDVLSIIEMGAHGAISCQLCHIPAFSRDTSTKVYWDWSTAGQDIPAEDIPVDEYGNPLYNKMKGNFLFAKNVVPTWRRHDGKWNKMIIGVNDTYTGTPDIDNPVVLGEPAANKATSPAKIYPFKKMVGKQVVDSGNLRVVAPHLWGSITGPNPYWGKYDWDLALQDSAAYLDIPYSGTFGFVDTVMYLTVNHEVAPKEQALGFTGSSSCADCHTTDRDWSELGRSGNGMSPAN